jgi:hypothetical protein
MTTEQETKRKRDSSNKEEEEGEEPTLFDLQQEIKVMSYALRDVCAKLDALEKTIKPISIKALKVATKDAENEAQQETLFSAFIKDCVVITLNGSDYVPWSIFSHQYKMYSCFSLQKIKVMEGLKNHPGVFFDQRMVRIHGIKMKKMEETTPLIDEEDEKKFAIRIDLKNYTF